MVVTDVAFKILGSGSADEPLETLYTEDELGETWEVKTSTDGHIETLKEGDLPENIVHHVVRDNFDSNSFNIDEDGVIGLRNEQTILNRLTKLDDEIVITEAAIQAGWYIELDYDPVTKRPSLAAKQRTNPS
ncbi:hypothetical protein MHBO_004735 [Bonamia ostreae]|uniref:Uncharacterized protein n=1 Tax=Bonamia ostreae TaxID=126728 RepID=A0ABV2AU62_9EUKA